MGGLAIKCKQAGDRTDPGDLAPGKSGCHGAAGWLEVTCRRKTSAVRPASWSLVEKWKESRRRPARADPLIRAAAHGVRGGTVGGQ
jgi:hypothetical protein